MEGEVCRDQVCLDPEAERQYLQVSHNPQKSPLIYLGIEHTLYYLPQDLCEMLCYLILPKVEFGTGN